MNASRIAKIFSFALALGIPAHISAQDGAELFGESGNPDRVSVVVAAAPREDLEKALSVLASLKKNRAVIPGEILIVGYSKQVLQERQAALGSFKLHGFKPPTTEKDLEELKEQAESRRQRAPRGNSSDAKRAVPSFEQAIRSVPYGTGLILKFGLQGSGTVSSQDIISRYNLQSSPAWIVRRGDTDYVLQGEAQIEQYFTAQGNFRPLENEPVTVTPKPAITGSKGGILRDQAPKTVVYPPRGRLTPFDRNSVVSEPVFTLPKR